MKDQPTSALHQSRAQRPALRVLPEELPMGRLGPVGEASREALRHQRRAAMRLRRPGWAAGPEVEPPAGR